MRRLRSCALRRRGWFTLRLAWFMRPGITTTRAAATGTIGMAGTGTGTAGITTEQAPLNQTRAGTSVPALSFVRACIAVEAARQINPRANAARGV